MHVRACAYVCIHINIYNYNFTKSNERVFITLIIIRLIFGYPILLQYKIKVTFSACQKRIA